MRQYTGAIYEYDVEGAALNTLEIVIYPKKIILHSEYLEVLKWKYNKKMRNIKIGLLQRKYPELKAIFTDNFKALISEFISLNKIDEKREVIDFTKDSIIVKRKCEILNIGNFVFKEQSFYTNLFVFKGFNGAQQAVFYNSKNEQIEIKGSKKYVSENSGLFKLFLQLAKLYTITRNKKELWHSFKSLRSMVERDYLDFIESDDKVILYLDGDFAIKLAFKNVEENFHDKISINFFMKNYFDIFCNHLLKEKS